MAAGGVPRHAGGGAVRKPVTDFYAARTCTRVAVREPRSYAPADLRGQAAYVLLGGPGAGKTEMFRREAEAEGGCYLTARDFIALDRAAWRDATLFIDGLDEARAGAADRRQPFDAVRARLEELGRPRFRISCRTVDWYGENDSRHLQAVSPDGRVEVFQLDPLADDAVRAFLEHHPGIGDAEEFRERARAQGMHVLLANPQSLQMLADLAANGDWPATRTELFDRTTRKLLQEQNQEHIYAEDSPPLDALMDAAGELCAVQLLAGINGYTSPGGGPSNCPGLDEMPSENHTFIERSLHTALFRKEQASGCIVPIHAQIAEFLAGRHLAKLIGNGLPARRILALMADADGIVAAGLRGLAAWLATHSRNARAEIIDLDPLGVALGADTRGFSSEEKARLLEHLRSAAGEHPWHRILDRADALPGDWTIPELGGLAAPEMENQLRECLQSLTPGDAGDTSFALILLEAIRHGAVLRGLAEPMMQIVENEQWESALRERALENYLRLTANDRAAAAELLSLLQRIESGQTADPDDQLAGRLLHALFPDRLSAAEVLQHLRRPKRPNYYGWCRRFWASELARPSTPHELLAELLDAFAAQSERLRNEFPAEPGNRGFHSIPAKLLANFLQAETGKIELPRLFAWLGAAAWHRDWNHLPQEAEGISGWLKQHPEEYKSLLSIGWKHCVEQSECIDLSTFRQCLYTVEDRFFNAALPQDLTRWRLGQAVAATDRIIKEYLIQLVADAVHARQSGGGLTAETVQKEIAHDAFLREEFRARLALLEAPEDASRAGRVTPREKQMLGQVQHQRERYEIIKRQERALRENRGDPGVLHFLAQAYLGEFADLPEAESLARLRRILNDDTALIEAALHGLRESINRDDLPDAAEVIRLGEAGRIHTLVPPFLVGIEAAADPAASSGAPLGQHHFRLALAIHYTHRIRLDREDQAWYRKAVEEQPRLVAEALMQSVRSDLRANRDCQENLYALAFPTAADHAAVARLAALPLLRSFRPRAAANQFPSLRILLFAAIQHGDRQPFLRLIERKLALSSMTAAQRTCWLAAGFWVAPETYGKKLQAHAAGHDLQIRQLVEFVAKAPEPVLARCGTASLPCLIQLLGPSCAPRFYPPNRSGMAQLMTSAMKAGWRIENWIKQLAADPAREATQALERLAADSSLRVWKELLENARHDQKELARKAGFRHPGIRQVVQTLRNGRPAHAADLAALTVDKLAEIAGRIRDGSPAEWRQYWNKNPRTRKALKPQHEEDCRDTLLSRLQDSLRQFGIDAQPEGHYADDKRSDIRVFCESFNVPVEIKKSNNPKLWTAIEEQLVKQYARDPGADGYGIYLVFWLGRKLCRPAPAGARPESAAELQRQLRDTLTEEQSRKISVRVLDIEPPAAAMETPQRNAARPGRPARRKARQTAPG